MYDQIVETIGSKLAKQKPVVDGVQILDYNPTDIAPPFKQTTWQGYPVYYDDEKHVYFIVKNDIRIPLISVTTFYDLFKPDFDIEDMALRCAQKTVYETPFLNTKGWADLPVDKRVKKIKKAWKDNNKDATGYGTVAHMAMECKAKMPKMQNSAIYAWMKYEHDKQYARPIIQTFLENIESLINAYLHDGYELVAEPVLASLKSGLAGQADLAAINHDTKQIAILDYKTNKDNPKTKTGFGQLEGLLQNYPNNSWTMYCLQLATYANMLLSQYKGYEVEYMALLWLNPETGGAEPLEINLEWITTVREIFRNLQQHNVFKRAYQYLNN